MMEVALGMGTVSERRAQLVRRLGEYSSRVYSADVLCRARSNIRTALRGGVNVLEELRVLHATMKPTFIRNIGVVPFYVNLWSKSMLDCYKETVRKFGRVEVYMDATGGIVHKVDDQDVYATSLVMGSPRVGRPQIASALMLSNCHDAATYKYFLNQWLSAVNDGTPVDLPDVVVIDFNWPSIHACSSALCGMDVVQHLRACMAIVQGQWTVDMIRNFTVIGPAR